MSICSVSIIILIQEDLERPTWKRVASGMAATPGALFEVDEYTLKLLDTKEGVNVKGCYEQISVTVYTAEGEACKAITYIHFAEDSNFFEPSKHYESLIRNGLLRLNQQQNGSILH